MDGSKDGDVYHFGQNAQVAVRERPHSGIQLPVRVAPTGDPVSVEQVNKHIATMAIGDDPSQLTHNDLAELLKDDISVKVGGVDVDGIVRGKLMSKKKFLSIAQSGFGFCSVIFGWDMHDQTYFKELKISNKENGYRDILAEVDLTSFRRIPWENNIPFFLCSFREPDGESLSACPRSLLERQCAKIDAKGMGAVAGGRSILLLA